jgi:hypothetical protein
VSLDAIMSSSGSLGALSRTQVACSPYGYSPISSNRATPDGVSSNRPPHTLTQETW